MYIICGWYALVIMIIGIASTIVKDGESKIKYTGGYKLTSILLNLPTIYFVWVTLFK